MTYELAFKTSALKEWKKLGHTLREQLKHKLAERLENPHVPGDALSVVVIAKLPFDVPSDPLVAARSETFEDPFNEYSIPEAILRFRQGFGRLIRSATDRGVVVILDRRLLSKSYGRLFIESLPQCTLRQGNLADLPKMAERWLGQ